MLLVIYCPHVASLPVDTDLPQVPKKTEEKQKDY